MHSHRGTILSLDGTLHGKSHENGRFRVDGCNIGYSGTSVFKRMNMGVTPIFGKFRMNLVTPHFKEIPHLTHDDSHRRPGTCHGTPAPAMAPGAAKTFEAWKMTPKDGVEVCH